MAANSWTRGADVPRPLLDPGAGGLDAGALVRLGLVLLKRGGAAPGADARMACDLPAPVERVDHSAAQANIDLLADMPAGRGVEAVVDGYAVVGMNLVPAPDGALPAPIRQRSHVRGVDAVEPAEAVLAGAVRIGLPVDLPDPGRDRPVQRCRIMEDMVAQRRRDLALDRQDSVLDEPLVPGLSDPRGLARDAAAPKQVGIGLVQDRLVARRALHRRLDVVGHDSLRRPAHGFEASNIGVAPVIDVPARSRLGAGPPRNPRRGDERPRPALDPVEKKRDGRAGVVDEQTFAGTAVPAHRGIPARTPVAEPAPPGRVAHPAGIRLAPLLPQQLQRRAAAGQLLLDLRPVHALVGGTSPPGRIKRRLQRRIVHAGRFRPARTRSGKPLQGLHDGATRDAAVGRNRASAAALAEMKRQCLLRFPHR